MAKELDPCTLVEEFNMVVKGDLLKDGLQMNGWYWKWITDDNGQSKLRIAEIGNDQFKEDKGYGYIMIR